MRIDKHTIIETAYKLIEEQSEVPVTMERFGEYVMGVIDLAAELVKEAEK